MHKEPAHHTPQRRSAAAYRKKQMEYLRSIRHEDKERFLAHLSATRTVHRALRGTKKAKKE